MHVDIVWPLALSVLVLAYGVGSVTGWIPWGRASLTAMALGMVVTVPVVGLGLYLSGASLSFIEPLLICSLLYAAFFFPPRWAWPLSVELVLVAGTPLLYDSAAIDNAFLPRYVALVAAFLAVAWVMMALKRRLVEAETLQRRIANRDHLTGIGNRRAFDAVLRREVEARQPQDESRPGGDIGPLTLLVLDLDGFKQINDRLGHQEGDAVLRATARRIRSLVRRTDMLARIGGDEFAVIAPGAGAERARGIARALQSTVVIDVDGDEVPWPIPSVGWAVFPDDAADADALIRVADERMLAAKRERTAGADAEIAIRARC